jgi:hypothetical protein
MIPTAFPAVMGHADSTLQRHRSNDTHGRFIEFGVKPSDRLRRWDVSLPLSSDVLPYCISARISNATCEISVRPEDLFKPELTSWKAALFSPHGMGRLLLDAPYNL